MKKALFILPVLLLGLNACNKRPDVVRLVCVYKEPADMSQLIKVYDVVVYFKEGVAVVGRDGFKYELKQHYDAPGVFYRSIPWYILQIGNPDFATKYTLGFSLVDGRKVYIPCGEV